MHLPRPRSGLSVLMGETSSEGRLVHLPLGAVRRNERQPREHFDQGAIDELASSIADRGVVQPIAVRQLATDGAFEIIAGERRWLASRQAGVETIPAVVHDVDADEALVMALVENVVRKDLGAVETARAYARLVDEGGLTISELARSVGKSRPAVSNTLRLLELPDEVIALIDSGQLSEGHGRALLALDSRSEQRRLARIATDGGLSVRATEVAVRNAAAATADGRGLQDGIRATRPTPVVDPEVEREVEELTERLFGAPVRIVPSRKSVRLEVRFSSARELGEAIEQAQALLATTQSSRY